MVLEVLGNVDRALILVLRVGRCRRGRRSTRFIGNISSDFLDVVNDRCKFLKTHVNRVTGVIRHVVPTLSIPSATPTAGVLTFSNVFPAVSRT